MYTNEFASQNRLNNLKSIIGRIEGENCVISSGPMKQIVNIMVEIKANTLQLMVICNL